MRVGVSILNYRTAELTTACLRSLKPELDAFPDASVVVADNGSADGSAEALRAALAEQGWGSRATLLLLERNGGYACGNNAAIRALPGADLILLLNPDTLVQPGAVRALVDFMVARPDAGICGSRLEGPDGVPQRSAFRFHTVLGELDTGARLGLLSRALSRW